MPCTRARGGGGGEEGEEKEERGKGGGAWSQGRQRNWFKNAKESVVFSSLCVALEVLRVLGGRAFSTVCFRHSASQRTRA